MNDYDYRTRDSRRGVVINGVHVQFAFGTVYDANGEEIEWCKFADTATGETDVLVNEDGSKLPHWRDTRRNPILAGKIVTKHYPAPLIYVPLDPDDFDAKWREARDEQEAAEKGKPKSEGDAK